MPFTVPTVDMSRWLSEGSAEDRAAVAAEFDEACRTVGFIQILGHGISPATIDAFASAMDGFFALDLETKKPYVAPTGHNRGYTSPKAETLTLSLGVEPVTRMNDFFEVALGLETGFFDTFTDHSIDVLRMNNYSLPPGTVDLDGDPIGMSEHTDFGIVTVLWADQVKELQVLGEGTWHDVSPADGALLINVGDLAARWTNERWMSALHRVKPPIIDGTIARRRSAAFFRDENADATITTIPSCSEPGTEPLYPPITVGEHSARKLAGSRAGTRNESAEREAARVTAASR